MIHVIVRHHSGTVSSRIEYLGKHGRAYMASPHAQEHSYGEREGSPEDILAYIHGANVYVLPGIH